MSKRFSGKVLGFSILVLTIFISVYLFMHSSFFNIDKINVTGLSKVSTSEIMALCGLKTGTNIFTVNQELGCRSIKIHPMVKDARVIRHLPRTLEIHVVEREMWAIIPYNGVFLCIDDEGVCLDKVNTMEVVNYPIITLENTPAHINLGQAVDPEATNMVRKVWEALTPASRSQISDFHYFNKDKGLSIFTVKGTEIKFGKTDQLEEKVQFFDQVFTMEKDLQDNNEMLEYVDLRYKGQPAIKTRV